MSQNRKQTATGPEYVPELIRQAEEYAIQLPLDEGITSGLGKKTSTFIRQSKMVPKQKMCLVVRCVEGSDKTCNIVYLVFRDRNGTMRHRQLAIRDDRDFACARVGDAGVKNGMLQFSIISINSKIRRKPQTSEVIQIAMADIGL